MASSKEIELFKKVNEKLWDFKSWKSSEGPDIIIKSKGRVIGVELTEVTRKDYGEIIAARYSLEDQLAQGISDQLNQSNLDLNLHGTIKFKQDLYLPYKLKSSFCSRVASTIIVHSKSLKKEAWSINHYIDKLLPEEISWISYDCYPFMAKSRFYPSRAKAEENLNREDVVNAVLKKEHKYDDYRKKCDEVYLLLTEGLLPASWIGELREPIANIQSKFDQIILFHYWGSKVIRVK